MHTVIILIIAVSIFSLSKVGPTPIPILFLIAGFYIYVVWPYERRWFTRREFAKRPDNNIEVQWLISAEKLCSKTSQSNSELLWTALAKVIQTRDGFLLYPTALTFLFLPKRGFCNEMEFQRLAELSQQCARKFIKMT